MHAFNYSKKKLRVLARKTQHSLVDLHADDDDGDEDDNNAEDCFFYQGFYRCGCFA